MSGDEIIELLGGTNAVAEMVGVRPPSVSEWRKTGIPESRLIELAASIERKAPDRFSRKAHWPSRYAVIWPELAQSSPDPHQQAQDAAERRDPGRVNPFPDLNCRRATDVLAGEG